MEVSFEIKKKNYPGGTTNLRRQAKAFVLEDGVLYRRRGGKLFYTENSGEGENVRAKYVTHEKFVRKLMETSDTVVGERSSCVS
jgi:hypothetical protein